MVAGEALKLVRSVSRSQFSVAADVLTFGGWSMDDLLEALHAADGCTALGNSLYHVTSGGMLITVTIDDDGVTVLGSPRS